MLFPTTNRYSSAFDREPSKSCGGGNALAQLNLAPHETLTWAGTRFLSDVGPHTFNSRMCAHDIVAEPVSFEIVERPAVTENVLIDFAHYPDGTSTENLIYLRDAYAAWGVQFVGATIGHRVGSYLDAGSTVSANLKIPAYGVSARVLTAKDRTVTMVALDQAGQELSAITSQPMDWPHGWQNPYPVD